MFTKCRFITSAALIFSLITMLPFRLQAGDEKTGYRVTIFRWNPRIASPTNLSWHEDESLAYTVVSISPTRDGKVHLNVTGHFEDWLWPDQLYRWTGNEPIKAENSSLRKWAESLALAIEDGVLDGYIDYHLLERDSRFHQDLKSKESLLDGRSAIVAMIKDNRVAASIRISFSDPKQNLELLPAEIRAPGGPREIFPPTPVVTHTVGQARHTVFSSLDEQGFTSRHMTSYQTGGKPAELKSLLNRKDLGANLLPTLFGFLEKSSFVKVVPTELGLPIPDKLVGETKRTIFEKVYANWGFKFEHGEIDPTIDDELVHVSIPTGAFAVVSKNKRDSWAYESETSDPSVKIAPGVARPAFRVITTEPMMLCRWLFKSGAPTFSDLFSAIDVSSHYP